MGSRGAANVRIGTLHLFLGTVLLLNSACAASSTGCSGDSGMPVFPDVVTHEVTSDPVMILNVFPEHGLTDPHNMIVGDRLYLCCGHDQSWDVDRDWTMDRWEIWSTDDLKTWRKESVIRPEDTYFGPAPNCWAGDFAQKDGKYYWYFSNRHYNTGVMVADNPGGPYHDALGKPLLPEDLTPIREYDPEVFEENGTYTIVFGAGTYYVATLADDMVSLADKPVPIVVKTPDGKLKYTDDKPTLFKRNGIYYLFWGAHYAMSDNVRGPYEYKGHFTGGGHGSVFNWKGQWYTVQEHHDIGMFYRGIMLKPLNFNSDGTVDLSKDRNYPAGGGRLWNFDRSRMGWRAVYGTDLKWTPEGTIRGTVTYDYPILDSAPWCLTWLQKGQKLEIRMRNGTDATQARVYFAAYVTDRPRPWFYPEIDWTREASATIDIKPNDKDFTVYELDLSTVPELPQTLKRMRLAPAVGARSGDWEIDYMWIQ